MIRDTLYVMYLCDERIVELATCCFCRWVGGEKKAKFDRSSLMSLQWPSLLQTFTLWVLSISWITLEGFHDCWYFASRSPTKGGWIRYIEEIEIAWIILPLNTCVYNADVTVQTVHRFVHHCLFLARSASSKGRLPWRAISTDPGTRGRRAESSSWHFLFTALPSKLN